MSTYNNNIILEREKMSPQAYFLYNYLCRYHVGKDNAIKQKDLIPRLNALSAKINFTDRDVRAARSECNTYDGNLKYICADNDGYYIAASDEEIDASSAIEIKKAIVLFKSFQNAQRRKAHHGQVKIVFSDYEKGLVEAFEQFDKKLSREAGIPAYQRDDNGQLKLPI
jgi:hypothetical protein